MAFDLAQYISSGFDTSTIEQTPEGVREASEAILANEEMFHAAGSVAPAQWARQALWILNDSAGASFDQVIDERRGDRKNVTLGGELNFWLGGKAQPKASKSAQQALATRPGEISASIDNELSNLANTFDFSALSPEQAQAELAGAISNSQQRFESIQSDIEMLQLLGQDTSAYEQALDQFVGLTGQSAGELAGTSAGSLPGVSQDASGNFVPSSFTEGAQAPVAGTNAVQQPDGTWSIVDNATGNVVESGFASAADAMSRQNVLLGGTAPERQDLGFTPANQDLASEVMATDGNLTANKDFVNAVYDGFLGRDATQAELDQWTGKTTAEVRAAVMAMAQGAANGDLSGVREDLTSELPGEFGTAELSGSLSDMVSGSDFESMLLEQAALQDQFVEALRPTAVELELEQQLIDIRSQAEKMLVELSMGLNDINDQPIAMQFITGQSASLEARTQTGLQNLARIESNLLANLGLEQDKRAVEASVLEAEIGFLAQNIQTAFQVESMMIQREESLFNRAQSLRTEARDTLSVMLDTFAGLDTSDLSADAQTQLATLAAEAGIPYDLLAEGMSVTKDAMLLDQSSSILSGMKQIGDDYYYEDPVTGEVRKFDPSNFELPGTQKRTNSLMGEGVVTAYGSSKWEPGLDYYLSAGKGADLSLPFGFETVKIVDSCPLSGNTPHAEKSAAQGCNSGFGNQVKIRVTTGALAGKEIWFSHLDEVAIGEGAYMAGTKIGTQGNTGNTMGPTGVHLDITMPKDGGGYYSSQDVARFLGVGGTFEDAGSQTLSPLAQTAYDSPNILSSYGATTRESILEEIARSGLDTTRFGLNDPTGGQRDQLAKFDDILSASNTAAVAVGEANTGPLAGRVNTLLAPFGVAPDFTAYKSSIDNMNSILLNLRSGAAVTEEEFQRISGYIPLVTDSEATASQKIGLFNESIAEARGNYEFRITQPTFDIFQGSQQATQVVTPVDISDLDFSF